MAQYQIKGADGSAYTIAGPDDADPSDVIAQVTAAHTAGTTPGADTGAPAAPPPAPLTFGQAFRGALGMNVAPLANAAGTVAAIPKAAAQMASGAVAAPVAGYAGMGTAAARGLGFTSADPANVVNKVQGALTYQPSSPIAQGLASGVNFLPGLFGRSADWAGGKVADATGSPAFGAAVNTGIQALPLIAGIKPTARALTQGAGSVSDLFRNAPTLPSAPSVVPSAAASSAEDVLANQDDSSRQSMGAAQVNPSPFQLTGQETGRGSPYFPQVKLAKNSGDVPADEQATRAGIVKEVLNDAGEDAGIRSGVITGNEQTLRSEYQTAKNPTQAPANALMASQIGAEQRALPTFAQQRINATGADPTLTNDYQRGETINNAFFGNDGSSSLKGFLAQQKANIYQAALDKNGANVIPTPATDQLLNDPQFIAGSKLMKNDGVVSGASDLIDLAKNVGFKDPVTGEQYAPGSVAAWNAVTKAMNKSWTPDNATTIGKINGAINQDIAASGGGNLYQLGNKIHQLDKGLMSDSPGINKVFGAVDPNGVQTGKPFETIPSTLNDMPLDQWRHIHDTLDTLSRGQIRGAPAGMDPVPPELQAAAARAKAEMEGSLARDVYANGSNNAGGWNANGANKSLNGRVGQKILDVLPPDEVRKFQVLNAAGQIMPGTHPYEGAGAQIARMGSEPGFVENYAPKAGAFLGAKAGVPGIWLGEKMGSKISDFTKSNREASHAANVSATLRNNLNLAPSTVYRPMGAAQVPRGTIQMPGSSGGP